jgi:hypothetical protein
MKLALPLALAVLFLSACQARKDFPEPNAGWHSPSFNAVFGRLHVLPGKTADDAPVWVIRFGTTSDPYQGELALMSSIPNSRSFLNGYSGGEPVELKGRLLDQPTTDPYNGRWYVVDSIQLWSGYRQ